MKCNTYRIHSAFSGSQVFTAEPENIKALLATRFNEFDLGPIRNEILYALIGLGVFTAERDMWPHFRKQLRPIFARDQISQFDSFERHCQAFFKALPHENSASWIEEADIMPLLSRLTMDISSEFLLGESLETQSKMLAAQDSHNASDVRDDIEFVEAIHMCQGYLGKRVRLGRLAWILRTREFNKAVQKIHDFIRPYVDSALERTAGSNVKVEEKKEKLIMLDELALQTRDPTELRNQVLHVFLAGRDTTSSLMGFMTLLLAKHPEQFKKLRKAVISQFGTETDPKEVPNSASVKACKPLLFVAYESLRLYPMVPLNWRYAANDTILPTGGGPDRDQPVAIKKGEQVEFSIYAMQRRQDIWGADADDFRPDRWHDRKLSWDWLPFGGGPRVCIGRKLVVQFSEVMPNIVQEELAINQVVTVFIRLLQRYDKIEALDEGPIPKGITFTLAPANGVRVSMHRASC